MNNTLLKYEDRHGLTISESAQHTTGLGSLFVVESKDGRSFHTITSTKELIKKLHPPKVRRENGRLIGPSINPVARR